VQTEPARRTELLAKARRLRLLLSTRGLTAGGESQIVPIRIGDPEQTMQLAAGLRDRGYLVPGIRPPSVPQGESLLRISLSCVHDEGSLEGLAAAIGELIDEQKLVRG
jgi:7-keto-8-aminopelargonate synthetase-like enzyme